MRIIILTIKSVNRRLPEFNEIRQLMRRAFPKNELIPMPILQLRALSRSVKFLAFYDKDGFCGFSYSVENEKIAFILYLAVNDKIRSRGYGAAIISQLNKVHKGKVLALNVEPLDIQADNYDQRVKRLNFYIKNGFQITNHYIFDKEDRYLVLCTEQELPMKEYAKVLKKMSFGLYTPKMEAEN